MLTRFALCLLPTVLLTSCGDATAPHRVSLEADIERTSTGIQYGYVVLNATEGAIYLPTCGGDVPLSFHTLRDGVEFNDLAAICPADQDMVPIEVPAGSSHEDSGYYGDVSSTYLQPYLTYAASMQQAPHQTVRARTAYLP